LQLDRPLPWLGLTRIPSELAGSDRTLIEGWPAYLVYAALPGPPDAPRSSSLPDRARELLEELAAASVRRFGAFLVLELGLHEQRLGASSVRVRGARPHEDVLRVLLEGLEGLNRLGDVPELGVREEQAEPANGGLLGDAPHVFWVTLDLDPLHFDPETGRTYPMVARALEIALDATVREACVRFGRHHTNLELSSAAAAGRKHVLPEEWSTDRALTRINESYDFLLNITPTNALEAWHQFSQSGYEKPPKLRYRPVNVDPEELRRTLFSIPIHHTEDPTLGQLFRAEQEGIDQKLRMLEQRDTPRFIFDSLHLYGTVDEALLASALDLLEHLESDPPHTPETSIDAPHFARIAAERIASYRSELPTLTSRVELRDDIASVMVAHGDLLIPRSSHYRLSRVQGLLAHEVGTHIVTFFNGREQPLKLLAAGLAGADELQEGLAVLAEALTGELTEGRLRLLAGRVVAVHRLTQGADFVEVFRELSRQHGFSARTSFDIALRVFRGGGFTKDAIYLRGLQGVLDYLALGRPLEVLLVGKLAFSHVPLVEELLEREVLQPPALIPHYLRQAKGKRVLAELKQGRRLKSLLPRRAA
jgi:uncharacterized protein (TIGR02421 family)